MWLEAGLHGRKEREMRRGVVRFVMTLVVVGEMDSQRTHVIGPALSRSTDNIVLIGWNYRDFGVLGLMCVGIFVAFGCSARWSADDK